MCLFAVVVKFVCLLLPLNLQTNVWEIGKSNRGSSSQALWLQSSTWYFGVSIHKLCRTQFWKSSLSKILEKLFLTALPTRHWVGVENRGKVYYKYKWIAAVLIQFCTSDFSFTSQLPNGLELITWKWSPLNERECKSRFSNTHKLMKIKRLNFKRHSGNTEDYYSRPIYACLKSREIANLDSLT